MPLFANSWLIRSYKETSFIIQEKFGFTPANFGITHFELLELSFGNSICLCNEWNDVNFTIKLLHTDDVNGF